MNIVFYGNRQVGMISLLTAMALGHRIIEVWEDKGVGIPGISRLSLRRRVIRSRKDMKVPKAELDVFLCVHGRRLVPEVILQKFRFGGVNLHPFLDKYPGADPVNRAISACEKVISVYAHKMTSVIDEGEIIAWAGMDFALQPGLDPVHVYNELYPLYAKVVSIVLQKLEAQF